MGRVFDWQTKSELELGVSVPSFPEGGLPDADFGRVLDLMESQPLRDEWLGSLPPALVEHDKLHQSQILIDRRARLEQHSFAGTLDAALRGKVAADDWSSVAISQMYQESPNGFDAMWRYSNQLSFTTDVETGEWMDMWGDYTIVVESPVLTDGLPAEWVEPVWDLLRTAATLLGALYGWARLKRGPETADSGSGAYFHYEDAGEEPDHDPDWLPMLEWLFLAPPRVVDKLGGAEQFLAEAPVHRAEPFTHADSRIGVIAQATELAQDFDDAARDGLEAYLEPVLRA